MHIDLKRILFSLPIGIGGVLGYFVFAGVIEAAFGTYAALFTALFIGFVAGNCLQFFVKQGSRAEIMSDWLIAIVSAVFLFVLMLLGKTVIYSGYAKYSSLVFEWFYYCLGIYYPWT